MRKGVRLFIAACGLAWIIAWAIAYSGNRGSSDYAGRLVMGCVGACFSLPPLCVAVGLGYGLTALWDKVRGWVMGEPRDGPK